MLENRIHTDTDSVDHFTLSSNMNRVFRQIAPLNSMT